MAIEHFKPGAAPEIYRRVREEGRHLPEGVEYLGSWVDLEYERCFQLMSTDDAGLFDQSKDAWRDLVDIEIVPVRTSAEAAQALDEGR